MRSTDQEVPHALHATAPVHVAAGRAAAWPLAGRAQPARAQPPAMPVIGYLGPGTPAALVSRVRAVRQGLEEAGYVEGRNVAIEFRWAGGQHDRRWRRIWRPER